MSTTQGPFPPLHLTFRPWMDLQDAETDEGKGGCLLPPTLQRVTDDCPRGSKTAQINEWRCVWG